MRKHFLSRLTNKAELLSSTEENQGQHLVKVLHKVQLLTVVSQQLIVPILLLKTMQLLLLFCAFQDTQGHLIKQSLINAIQGESFKLSV